MPAEQQRLVAEPRADFADRVVETAGGNRQYALTVFELFDAAPLAVDQIGTPVGRAPVDGDETFCPAHALIH